jgi:nitrite reductase/ring-hydroxylating ferredoxin subunit
MEPGQPNDRRPPIDVRIDSPAREGLTGTTPADRYSTLASRDTVTVAPDFQPADAQPAWRHDFPIDWPQDQYVERRDFVKFLVLISAAFTAGQFWIAGQNWLRRRRGLSEIRRVASLDDLGIGGAALFAYPTESDPCVIVRLGERELVAYSQKCTHLSCAVIPKPAENVLRCPCHEGAFDLPSGRPIAGPPLRPLPRITLELRGREIFATGVTVNL